MISITLDYYNYFTTHFFHLMMNCQSLQFDKLSKYKSYKNSSLYNQFEQKIRIVCNYTLILEDNLGRKVSENECHHNVLSIYLAYIENYAESANCDHRINAF